MAPQYVGDTVTLEIYANTAGGALNLWWPKVTFNNVVLQFTSLTVGNAWNNPTKLLEDAEVNNEGVLEVTI